MFASRALTALDEPVTEARVDTRFLVAERFRPVELARLPQLDARLRVEPHDEARLVERCRFFCTGLGPEPGIPRGMFICYPKIL